MSCPHRFFALICILFVATAPLSGHAADLNKLLETQLPATPDEAAPASAPVPVAVPKVPASAAAPAVKNPAAGLTDKLTKSQSENAGLKSLLGNKDSEIGALTNQLGDTNQLLDSVKSDQPNCQDRQEPGQRV